MIETILKLLNPIKDKTEQRLHFAKEDNGNWYIVLPNWPFAHANLQMVAGADDLLEELSKGTGKVSCSIKTKESYPQNSVILTKTNEDYGADYSISGANTKRLWLCPVTTYVFGEYPDTMYITDITNE